MDDATARSGSDRGSTRDGTAEQVVTDAAAAQAHAATEASGTPAGGAAGDRSGQDRQDGAAAPVHLSSREVELVIARALDLQHGRATGAGEGLTLTDLQAVAAQVGVGADLVRRAWDDVRFSMAMDDDWRGVDRLIGPRQVGGAVVVPNSVEDVSRAVAAWMTTDEGMQRTGSRHGVDRWAKDGRLLVQVRHGLQATRGEGTLRDLRVVTTQVEPAADGTAVVVEADTSRIRTTTTVIGVSGILAGIGVGAAAAVGFPEAATIGSDTAQFVTGFGMVAASGVGVATVVGRTWLRHVRAAVRQALDGISMTIEDPQDSSSSPRSGDWRGRARRWLGGDA